MNVVSRISSAVDSFSPGFPELNFLPTKGSKWAAVASCVSILVLAIIATNRDSTYLSGGICALSVGALICSVVACVKKPLVDFTSVESRQKANEADPARSITGNLPPLSQEGLEALSFAFKKLEEHPKTKPTVFKAGYDKTGKKTHQPVNQQIARLHTLCIDVNKTLKTVIQKNKESDPWSQKEVIDAADAYIKIHFAIGILTLEDLPAFLQSIAQKENPRTYAQALTEQDSYQYRTFYWCSFTYRDARFFKTWDDEADCLIAPDNEVWDDVAKCYVAPKNRVSDQQKALFETAGTQQNKWRKLYNEYCERTRMYVSENDLFEADKRHARWTTKDTGKDFVECPDHTPT
jgi:hypothetical protein